MIDGSTHRHYTADFRKFVAWCEERGRPSLPADVATLAEFVSNELASGFAAPTIGRRLAAISYMSRLAGFVVPTGNVLVRSRLNSAATAER